MQRLLSSKTQGRKDFWKPSKPYHVGINLVIFKSMTGPDDTRQVDIQAGKG